MTVYGWDCSDFDAARGPMDIAAAYATGIRFMTHKATEGITVRHVHYGEVLNRARTAGVPVLGAYIVPRTPSSSHGTVAQQVDYFLAYLDAATPWWRTWPHWILQVDLERWKYDEVQPDVGVEMCALLRRRTGRFVVLYAPRWAYGDTIGGSDPLWSSDYGPNAVGDFRQLYTARGGDSGTGWRAYSGRTPAIWQYGSNAIIGSQPNCDANAFRGTLDQLLALTSGAEEPVTTLDDMFTGPDGVQRSYAHMIADLHGHMFFAQWAAPPYTASVQARLADLLDRPPVGLTDDQIQAIAAAVVAADNPLGPADQPAIVEAVKQALRGGTG